MAAIDKLFRAKERQDNEFYTKYEQVQWFFDHSKEFSDYFRNKIIYCPCDTEQSNIVKYLKDNQLRLGIKDVLYTSDDYYSHEDLYKKADLVFTNPPFTKIKRWLTWLNSNNYKFISWFPMMGLYGFLEAAGQYRFIGCITSARPNTLTAIGNYYKYEDGQKLLEYLRPDGSVKKVAIYLISNDLTLPKMNYVGKDFTKSIEQVKDKLYMTNNGYYEAKLPMYFPNDYFEPYYISLTAYVTRQKYFKFIKTDGVTCKDGKSRPRVLVQPIKEEIEKLCKNR